jgi:hypothetical protein
MLDYLVHFFTNNKIYLFTGVVLLILVVIPTREKVSPKSQKLFYLAAIIWIICFAYRVNTGQDIISLFSKTNDFHMQARPDKLEGPFNKYYSNEAGRKPKYAN